MWWSKSIAQTYCHSELSRRITITVRCVTHLYILFSIEHALSDSRRILGAIDLLLYKILRKHLSLRKHSLNRFFL